MFQALDLLLGKRWLDSLRSEARPAEGGGGGQEGKGG